MRTPSAMTTHLATVATRSVHHSLEGHDLVRVEVHVSAGARSALLCGAKCCWSARGFLGYKPDPLTVEVSCLSSVGGRG